VSTAVGVMARAPSSAGKTRLAAHLSPSRLIALRSALLADTLHALAGVPHVTIFFTPDNAEEEIATAVGRRRAPAFTIVPALVRQDAGDLGARMLGALRHLLSVETCDAALLVGSDIPLLTADHVLEAADTLQASGGVVLGPADDGGYYLIGMTEAREGLFDGIAWGTDSVLTDTLRAAARIGVEARLARSAYDVDTIEDLRRLERDLALAPADRCAELRRWFSEG
jgi:rSAM/selenodomain-associated transferase 1